MCIISLLIVLILCIFGEDNLLNFELFMTKEQHIEDDLIKQLIEQKYSYRLDIRNRESLEKNFKEKFEALNCVKLSDSEFNRLKEEINLRLQKFYAIEIHFIVKMVRLCNIL